MESSAPSTEPITDAEPTFGLYLNFGANLGDSQPEVFAHTLAQVDLADECGYDELWVTEHHFIPFGINPSSLTAAGFLLGRTERMRVGTAVTLSPLLHPIEVAERAALLDQLSGGRFMLGLGRGGYVRDYEVLGVEQERWDDEPATCARMVLDAWQNPDTASDTPGLEFESVRVEPRPLTTPHPPLLLATSSGASLHLAAQHGLAIQHYFASPIEQRVGVVEQYRQARADLGLDETPGDHLHCLIVIVTDDPDSARVELRAQLTRSFHDGDWPAVARAKRRHVDSDGNPLDRGQLATWAANQAIVGTPGEVVDAIGAFRERTGASRFAIYAESIADRTTTLRSIERFADEVAPQLTPAA